MNAENRYKNLIEWYKKFENLNYVVFMSSEIDTAYFGSGTFEIVNKDHNFDTMEDCDQICDELNDLLDKLKQGKIAILDEKQICPFCNSNNIHTFISQHSKCKDCKEQWTD